MIGEMACPYGGILLPLFANVDSEAVKAQAVAKVQSAVERQKNKVSIL